LSKFLEKDNISSGDFSFVNWELGMNNSKSGAASEARRGEAKCEANERIGVTGRLEI